MDQQQQYQQQEPPVQQQQQYPATGNQYQQFSQPIQDDGRWILSFVDFVPSQMSQGGMMTMPTYEPFSTLIIKANQWLQQNPGIKVKVCESIEVKYSHMGSGGSTEPSYFYESGKMSTFYIRCLRLWIMPKETHDNPAPQQIGYLNVIPACLDQGGLMSLPKFEGYGQTMHKLNQILQENPIQGRILNVETQDIKFGTWGNTVNPDETFWRKSGEMSTFYLNMIRLFYETGPPCYEQIGSVDFVPGRLSQGGMMTMGAFEPLHVVTGRANEWMSQNPGTPVVNTQTIDYKLSSNWGGGQLDTQQTIFRESGKMSTFYVKIIRVYYAVSSTGSYPRPPISCLNYRTFVPCQLAYGGMMSMPQFETQTQTMQRAMAWLKLTNAKVIGCETVPVKMFGIGCTADSERTYTYNSGNHADNFLLVLRIFLDGIYQDPPPQLLPPPPQITASTDQGCCRIM